MFSGYAVELRGWVVGVASVGNPDEGRGKVNLYVRVFWKDSKSMTVGFDSWIVPVPAEQVKEAQAYYPPGEGAVQNVKPRAVSISSGRRQVRNGKSARLLRRRLPRPLQGVTRVKFGGLHEDGDA